jgi:RNA polymerase sigma-70 factor (ECF subfamily)
VGPAADECDPHRRADAGPSADTDQELLRRVAERDVGAFNTFYRRYARAVYGLALRRLSDRERAEDATRRAFTAMWGSAASSSFERGDGGRWVFSVAQRAIVGDVAQEAAADDGWQTFLVQASVAALPELERAPLELAYWGDRQPAEIAELLGLPLDAVSTRLRSALERLAARLDRFP